MKRRRKMAQARLTGARTLFLIKLGSIQDGILTAEQRMYLALAFSVLELRRPSIEITPLEVTYAIPNVILSRLEIDSQVAEAIFGFTECYIEIVLEVTQFYATGRPPSMVCSTQLLVNAMEDFVQSYQIEEAQKEFEREVLGWSYLDEYFALGGLMALESKYQSKGVQVLVAMANRKGLLGEGLFEFWETGRDAYIQDLYTEINNFASQVVEPVVQAKLNQAN